MGEPDPTWQVLIQRRAEKALRRLDKPLRRRIGEAINQLVHNPRPAGCKKLTGYDNLYRLRVGNWRISYALEEDKLIVLVVEIAPRGQAYRHL
ncbi:MAG TPA: type II toxin-antitoxin system RelE/ParE family toxin [Candidatus Saccharimonadales bacterium]